MPKYLGKDVSDDYLQGLIKTYSDGVKSKGGNPGESDQEIIDRLESQSVISERAPSAWDLGVQDGESSAKN